MRANFLEVNYDAFIIMKEKKRDPRFFDHVSYRILLEESLTKSSPMACFCFNTRENLIFSLKYCQ